MKDVTNQAVRAAIDDCLSGMDALPSVRAAVLNQTRGEVKVKKKLSVGLVFAIVLMLLNVKGAMLIAIIATPPPGKETLEVEKK